MNYFAPVLFYSVNDWPSGSSRVPCEFRVEYSPKRGYRISRRTQDRHGNWCKPKVTTYGGRAVICRGEDGRTYIVQDTGLYGFIRVSRSDFMDHETIWPERSPERFNLLLKMIRDCYDTAGSASPDAVPETVV